MKLIIIACFLMQPFISSAQHVEELFSGKVSTNLLKKDLDFIRKDLIKHHQNLYLFIDKKKFDWKFDSLKNTIKVPITRMEFRYKVLTLLQGIGDGHLTLILDASSVSNEEYEKYVANRVLPIQQFDFKVIDSKLYVVGNTFNSQISVGSEIVSMNGLAASEVVSKMVDGLSADGFNMTLKYFTLNAGLFSTVYASTFGQQDSIDFRIRNLGEEKSVVIRNTTGQLNANSVLLSPQNTQEFLQDQGYAVLKVGTFNNPVPQNNNLFFGGSKSSQHSLFFGNLKFQKTKVLILDLRNNIGGEQSNVTELFSYLIDQPSYFAVVPKTILDDPKKTPSESMKVGVNSMVVPAKNAFEGKIYMLINGGSFSATAILAANLQSVNKNITIVGEESGGGREGCTAGSFRQVNIKNSNLTLSYGDIPIKSISSGGLKGRGVIPDINITYELNDYLSKRDLEMEWVKNDINSATKTKVSTEDMR